MKIIVTSILLAANLFCCTQNKSTDKGTSFIGKIDKKTFLKAYEELISKNVQFLESNHKAIFGSNLSTFNSLIDSLKWTENTLVTNYQNSNENIDLIFIDSLITEKEYKHKRFQLLYPHNFHRYSNFKKKANVPPDYFINIMAGSFSNPTLLLYKEYLKCMNYYFDVLSAKEYKFSNLEFVPLKRLDNRYDAIRNLDANQEIKDFFIKEHFSSNIWTYRVEAFDYSYKKALTDVKNEAFIEEIKSIYKMGFDRRKVASEIITYRTIDGIQLNAHIFYPESHNLNKPKPAHLFFHGGGWAMGMPEWTYESCQNAAADGRIAITFDYRLRNIHGTDIKASLSDALFAIAWVRENADVLGVNPNKILIEGFSAGAHLAMSSTMIENPKEFGVNSKFSSEPNAVIISSCPYDIAGRDVYNIDYDTKIISPLYLIKSNLPPILAFHGEQDDLVKFSEFEKFRDKMLATNNDFIYRTYPNAGHFYFSEITKAEIEEIKTLTEEFLVKNGYVLK